MDGCLLYDLTKFIKDYALYQKLGCLDVREVAMILNGRAYPAQ